jgi:hypothetical protein
MRKWSAEIDRIDKALKEISVDGFNAVRMLAVAEREIAPDAEEAAVACLEEVAIQLSMLRVPSTDSIQPAWPKEYSARGRRRSSFCQFRQHAISRMYQTRKFNHKLKSISFTPMAARWKRRSQADPPTSSAIAALAKSWTPLSLAPATNAAPRVRAGRWF